MKDVRQQEENLRSSAGDGEFETLISFKQVMTLNVLNYDLLAQKEVNHEVVTPCNCQVQW
jgi:hypothetical protein